MADDGDQLPGCAACQFIGRICLPDCPLAPRFVSTEIHTANFASLKGFWNGKNAMETARSYPFQELHRTFIEGAIKFFAGDSAGEEGRRLLVEAILSEVEKEAEPPPEPAGFSTSYSTSPEFSSPVGISALTRAFAALTRAFARVA